MRPSVSLLGFQLVIPNKLLTFMLLLFLQNSQNIEIDRNPKTLYGHHIKILLLTLPEWNYHHDIGPSMKINFVSARLIPY